MGSKSQNLLQLLKSRGFINQIPLTTNGKTLYAHDYGAPGTFLRHNIKRQWWKSMIHENSDVFAIETSPLRCKNLLPFLNSLYSDGSGDKAMSNTVRNSLQNDCRDKYMDILTLANSRLPFSIATTGERLCDEHTDCDTNNHEKTLFLKHAVTTEMVLQNYVPPSNVSRIFDYWLQLRLSWWKKFSKNPSKFKVISTYSNEGESHFSRINEISTNSSNGQCMSIVYDFSWGPETLELVHNIGDEELKKLQELKGTNYMAKASGSKSVLPHCIQCTANLEMAMAAFIVDGYHDRKSLSKSKSKAQTMPILQLHSHLSPFHVALVITTNQSTSLKELCHISRQMEIDLLKVGVSVFNASEHVGTLNAHFKRNDQLGIPYTLIFNENTLKDGILSSRDRDTEIKKPVHVSKAVDEISRNVKAILY